MSLNRKPTPLELIEDRISKLEHVLQEANQSVNEIKAVLAQIDRKPNLSASGNRATYIKKASEDYDVSHTAIVSFQLKGAEHEVPSGWWNHFVRTLCQILNDKDSNKFRSLLWEGECVKWFHPSPKSRTWERVDGTDIYTNGSIPAPRARDVAIELIARFGYEKEDLVFQLRDKPNKKNKQLSGCLELR